MQTEIAYLSRHMEPLAEQLSREEIICDEGVDEDDEEIKKLEIEKVITILLLLFNYNEFLNIFFNFYFI